MGLMSDGELFSSNPAVQAFDAATAAFLEAQLGPVRKGTAYAAKADRLRASRYLAAASDPEQSMDVLAVLMAWANEKLEEDRDKVRRAPPVPNDAVQVASAVAGNPALFGHGSAYLLTYGSLPAVPLRLTRTNPIYLAFARNPGCLLDVFAGGDVEAYASFFAQHDLYRESERPGQKAITLRFAKLIARMWLTEKDQRVYELVRSSLRYDKQRFPWNDPDWVKQRVGGRVPEDTMANVVESLVRRARTLAMNDKLYGVFLGATSTTALIVQRSVAEGLLDAKESALMAFYETIGFSP